MDDRNNQGSGFILNTSVFNLGDLALLQNTMLNNWGIKTSIYSLNIIYIRSISKIKYIYLIKPCLHRSIVYKIIKKYLISALTNLTFYSTVLISYYFLRKSIHR